MFRIGVGECFVRCKTLYLLSEIAGNRKRSSSTACFWSKNGQGSSTLWEGEEGERIEEETDIDDGECEAYVEENKDGEVNKEDID